ncbi:hypothetical protein SSP24_08480 [Streptomyces spinoverrucosus]|uniref:Uncharacterized protein n=1 Tax=Streptomyces spinoverrucosus TaxID=284043 RepID=A0A4Y3VA04_9ACTN|nr:hypothetical protein SSP24_08480 [Streptomyces spinoverrucosus]GHB37510.1 hypothetical protein GCM10010397_04080 [Streptomyces spinoverrucosus]
MGIGEGRDGLRETGLHGCRPGASELRSWERSIPALSAALNDAGLGDVEVMLKYALPLNSKRVRTLLRTLREGAQRSTTLAQTAEPYCI